MQRLNFERSKRREAKRRETIKKEKELKKKASRYEVDYKNGTPESKAKYIYDMGGANSLKEAEKMVEQTLLVNTNTGKITTEKDFKSEPKAEQDYSKHLQTLKDRGLTIDVFQEMYDKEFEKENYEKAQIIEDFLYNWNSKQTKITDIKKIEKDRSIKDEVKKQAKEKAEDKYMEELEALKSRGKTKKYFIDSFKKESEKEKKTNVKPLFSKSVILGRYIENNYGFITLESLLYAPILIPANIIAKVAPPVGRVVGKVAKPVGKVAGKVIGRVAKPVGKIVQEVSRPINELEQNLNKVFLKARDAAWKTSGAQNVWTATSKWINEQPFYKWFGGKFIHEHNWPDWYKNAKEILEKEKVHIDLLAEEMLENLSNGLDIEQKIQLHQAIVNNGNHPDADIQARAKAARRLIDRLGEQYYKSGAISQEVYEANKGYYLASFYYNKSMFNVVKNYLNKGGSKASLKRAMSKGVTEAVPEKQVKKYSEKGMGWKISKEQKNAKKGEVVMWRDWTKKEKEEMGAILDSPEWVVYKTAKTVGHDVAYLSFLKKIAENKEFASKEYKKGFELMPRNDAYGDLKGMFVKSEIYKDVVGTFEIQEQSKKVMNKGLMIWKKWKVIYNPSTHFRNMYFNFILSDIAGLSPTRVDIWTEAFEQVLKKGDLYTEARKALLFKSSWAGNELSTVMSKKQALQLKEGTLTIKDILENTKNIVAKGDAKLTELYEAEEQWNKMGLYLYARKDLKMTPSDAAKFAKKWGLDYSAVTTFWQKYSTKWYGIPFLRFPVLVAPRLVEAAATRPVTLAKWWAVSKAIQAISKAALGWDDEDVENAKKSFPSYMKKGLFILAPTLDKNGDPQFIDLTYIVPYSQEVKDPSKLLENWVFGNPIYRIPSEIYFNKSLFTGEELYDPDLTNTTSSSVKQIIGASSEHAYKQIMPSMAPGNYGWEKLKKAIMGNYYQHKLDSIQNDLDLSIKEKEQKIKEITIKKDKYTDYTGRLQSLNSTILSTMLGLKVKALNISESKKIQLNKIKKASKKVEWEIYNIRKDHTLSEAQKIKQIEKLVDTTARYHKQYVELLRTADPTLKNFGDEFIDLYKDLER